MSFIIPKQTSVRATQKDKPTPNKQMLFPKAYHHKKIKRNQANKGLLLRTIQFALLACKTKPFRAYTWLNSCLYLILTVTCSNVATYTMNNNKISFLIINLKQTQNKRGTSNFNNVTMFPFSPSFCLRVSVQVICRIFCTLIP